MDTNKLIPLLSEMAIFTKVVELGSFSKAAKKLGIAPSSVSRTLSRLENALEEKLLERTTRQMKLTPVGQEVFIFCSDMLNSAQLAVSAAQSDQSNLSGALRVAAPKALCRHVLTPIVLSFIKKHPNIAFQLKVADHLIDPIGDEVDIIIHITDSPIEGLIAKPLGKSRLILGASPEYIKINGSPTHPGELTHYNCICLGEDPKDRVWEFTNQNQQITTPISGSFATNHSEIRREAVLQNIGISIFPEFAVKSYLQEGKIIEILPDWYVGGKYQGDIIAQYAQSKFIPSKFKVFIEYMQESFQAL